jgi:hypothetical protein
VDVACAGSTVTAKAISTRSTIEVVKQNAGGTWTVVQLRTGGMVTTGSPTTASPDNTGPIDVQVLRGVSVERARVVGAFQLAPGDSVDVAVVPVAGSRDEQLRFSALRGAVTLTIEGRSRTLQPGVVESLPVDRTPPRVSCAAADGRWHGDNVGVACAAQDDAAGLALASDASFTLNTAVAAEVETAVAETETREVCDADGNCAVVEAIGGHQVDRKAPEVRISQPADRTAYLLHQMVPAAFDCEDGGSGVSTCEGTTARGREIPTGAVGTGEFTVTATDAVGHAHTASVSYDVTYAIVPVDNGPLVAVRGQVLPIRVRIADAQKANQSAADILLTARAVVSDATGTTVDLDAVFRFDPQLRAYALNLDARGLEPGGYTLSFTVSGDPVMHTVPFRLR